MRLLEGFLNNNISFNETQKGDNGLINYNQKFTEEPIFIRPLFQPHHDLVTVILKKLIKIFLFVICVVVIRKCIISILGTRQVVRDLFDAVEQEFGDQDGGYEEEGDPEELEEGQEEVVLIGDSFLLLIVPKIVTFDE